MNEYDIYDQLEADPLALCAKMLNWPMQIATSPEFNQLAEKIENTHSIHGIIKEIRAKYKNADDLAMLETAIEAMREELIEESAARFERATHA
jgi:hypothetical protein